MKNQYAVLIGMGADLPVTIDDALGLQKVLVDPLRCGFPPANVTTLTGSQAYRSAILDALDQLVRSVDAESTVVIFFSGHGLTMHGPDNARSTYLIPFGFDEHDPVATAISDAEFARSLKQLRSKKVLVLLDCCHARGIAADAVKAPGATPPSATLVSVALPQAIKQIATADAPDGGGRVVISGSMASEFSLTGQPYSLFTRAIIGALCGEQYKDKEPDSEYVTTSDIAGYAREKVPLWS